MNSVRTILVSGAMLGMAAGAVLAGGDGKALFEAKCTICHAASRALSVSKDKAGWQATVERMKAKGAQVDAAEAAAIADYLVKEGGK